MRLTFLLILFLLVHCSTKTDKLHLVENAHTQETGKTDTAEVIKLLTGTRFKFKGLAIDTKNSYAYLGSYDKNEIVAVSLLNGTHEVLKTKYSSRLKGMGCYVKNDRLYAVMNEINENVTTGLIAVLLIFDIADRSFLRSYESTGINGRNHFNHVTVDGNGIAYISNTLKSSIYTVNTNDPADSLKKLVEHSDLSWVHGLDVSPDGARLFTTSYDGGIKFFNLKTGKFSDYRDISLAGDDGLKYYKGFLYGVGQNMIKRYTLNYSEDRIIKADTLVKDHEYFNDPRCLHIEDGVLHCLANIEFEPVIFRKNNKSHRSTALSDTYLLKFKLPEISSQ